MKLFKSFTPLFQFLAARTFPFPNLSMRLWLLFLPFWALTIYAFIKPMVYGLDTPEPIGAYLNSTFPDEAPVSTSSWGLTDAFPNLTFTDPVQLVELPGTQKFLLAGKKGRLWTFNKNATATTKTVFLNIEGRVKTGGDSGILGVAFHPEYAQSGSPNRGYFYLFYRYTPDQSHSGDMGYLRLSRFHVPNQSTVADPNSEYVLIQQYDRHDWHNGGGMFFGPDGFLYLSIGDEGGANDVYNATQKINGSLFSGVLRIDVDQNSSRSHPVIRQPQNSATPPSGWPNSFTQGYYIPNNNPWVNPNGSVLEEFYAIGLRSPHRMTRDPNTGKIWVGDIGEGGREEVSLVTKGANLQWPFKEGILNGPKARPANLIGTEQPPFYDYGRNTGTAVIGGFVYRGNKWPGLRGKYIFGDHTSEKIWAMDPAGGTPQVSFIGSVPSIGGGWKSGLSSFATDAKGEIYILDLYGYNLDGGKIFKLIGNSPVPDPPQWLSQTGAFSDLATLTPAQGIIPYSVNSPLWTDGALKKRWIAIPNDGNHNSPAEQITFAANSEWTFPKGTVFIKQFDMPLNENNPGLLKRMETRFIVVDKNRGIYGLTYKWNAAGTDAELLADTDTTPYTVTHANGSQSNRIWTFPSRSDCMTCHTQNTGGVIGVNTHQLNGEMTYPSSGIKDNQLKTWNHLGIFATPIDESNLNVYPRSVDIDDQNASLETKVRSYLDANCGFCHRPGGVDAHFDGRFTTPLAQQSLVYGSLAGNYGIADAFVVYPRDTLKSILYIRDKSSGINAMPPLGKSVVHEAYIQVLKDWINSLDPGINGCVGLSNLALGKPTAQSSTYINEATYGSWKLVDGDTDGETSLNHTQYDTPPWWEVDLGEASFIQHVNIFNRTSCCASRASDYYVLVSATPFPAGPADPDDPQYFRYFSAEPPGSPSTVPVQAQGRYVRIQLKNQSQLHLAEVEVVGCPAVNTPIDSPEQVQPEVAMYPNPMTDWVNMQISHARTASADVQVLNELGQVVFQLRNHPTGEILTIQQDWPAGVYIARVQMNGLVRHVKVVNTKR